MRDLLEGRVPMNMAGRHWIRILLLWSPEPWHGTRQSVLNTWREGKFRARKFRVWPKCTVLARRCTCPCQLWLLILEDFNIVLQRQKKIFVQGALPISLPYTLCCTDTPPTKRVYNY